MHLHVFKHIVNCVTMLSVYVHKIEIYYILDIIRSYTHEISYTDKTAISTCSGLLL